MAVTVLTPASTFRLTTLEAVIAEITLADQLLFVESLIDQASAAVARYCGCIFAQQRYREFISMDGVGPYLTLGYHDGLRPLVQVDSVSLDTEVFTDWRIHSYAANILSRRGGWGSRYRSGWGYGYAWGSGGPEPTWEWAIDFVAGYILPEQHLQGDLPVPLGPELTDDIERATIEACKVWFGERLTTERVASRTLGDQRIDYGLQSMRRGLPVLSQDLLKPYKRLRVA